MSIAFFFKSPSAILDYQEDWSGWLGTQTITTSTWSVPTGITKVTDTHTSTTTTIRLSGGTWGTKYRITNTIVSNTGQSDSRTISINVYAPYVYPADVRAVGTQITANSTSNPASDTLLQSLIERASRMFDLACGVEAGYFGTADPQGVATSKTIYGANTNYLKLPPYIPGSLSSTVTYPDGYTAPTFIERDGYLVFTSNGVAPPFTYSPGFYSGVPLTLSAIWGFDETPEDVKEAVIELTINLFRETDPAALKLVNIEGQPLRETLPPRVKEIAKRYRAKGAVFV